MAMLRESRAPTAHPHRSSVHLDFKFRRASVCSSLASSECSRRAKAAREEEARQSTAAAWTLSVVHSSDSNGSSGSTTAPAETWFEQSNRNVGRRLGSRVIDNDPPYFLQHLGTPSPKRGRDSDGSEACASSVEWTASQFALHLTKPATHASSAGDYRSVIDDLTIENKKLKDRLRKYETPYGPELEKDRLFEVKVHGLSPNKKRELEQTLHAFASSINKDESSNESSNKSSNKSSNTSSSQQQDEISPRRASKKLSPSATSNSQHVDSAYASMSAKGPKSTLTSNNAGSEKRNEFLLLDLDETPEGTHPAAMTERGKKKLVVKRLEQLFTGKLKSIGAAHLLHLQQQDISNAAARADRLDLVRRGAHLSVEGVREANILSTETVAELPKTSISPTSNPGVGSSGAGPAEGEQGSDPPGSPDQRPTRPLDLDPERAQVPADNIEYIRHLGVSTPLMAVENLVDITTEDGHGWIYLNLLVNMAQLHIINVTPDFVRSAVMDLSTHFQLSPDGRKIRWKGGIEGTELSSDSGADSNGVQPPSSPSDSDGHEEHHQKRRKIIAGSSQTDRNAKLGRFPKIPPGNGRPARKGARLNEWKYKPLFAHRSITDVDQMSLDDSVADDGAAGQMKGGGGWRSQPAPSSKSDRNEGAMIFYTGATFCTDLAGDKDNIPTPLHVTAVDIDGFSNHTDDAIGCKHRPVESPTPSGPTTPFRAFSQESDDNELISQPSDSDSADLNFSPQWSVTGLRQPNVPPLSLEVSGLGGTRPADHFTLTVKTMHTKLDDMMIAKLAKGPAKIPSLYGALRHASRSSLDSPSTLDFCDRDTSTSASSSDSRDMAYMPLKAEIISVRLQNHEPSNLPPPATYHGASSCSSSSDDASSDNVRGATQTVHRLSLACPSDSPPSETCPSSSMDDDESSSIDMLAYARERDPATVAAKEEEFERQVADLGPVVLPVDRAAATTYSYSIGMNDSEMSED